MIRKNYFILLATAALFLLSGTIIFAQNTPIKGKVQMKAADGKVTPVEGATIDFYRTDVASGKLASVKTDAQGMYTSENIPAGQVYAVVVSAPNASPTYSPGAKGGQTLDLMLTPGAGGVPGEAEVREAVRFNSLDPNSAEYKKAMAENEKKIAESTANAAKIKASNETVNRVLKEGNDAYNAKNYDVAIAKYDEGYNAAPDFIGSAPVLLNNKANALLQRAIIKFNDSHKADPSTKKVDAAVASAAMPAVKKDLEDSIDASEKSLKVLSSSTGDAANKKEYDSLKYQALSNRKEGYQLLTKTGADRTRGKEAGAAFQEYLAVETDPKKKAGAQLGYAQSLQDAQEFDQAAAEFQKILADDPNNVDALSGAAFNLVTVGYTTNDKAKFQEATNYLQKFVQVAPDTNPLKDDAKGLIETLKKEQNVTPKKVETPAKKKS